MHARARRSVTAGLGVCIVAAVGLSACGGGSEPVETGTGAGPAPTETAGSAADPTSPPTTGPAPTTAAAEPPAAAGPSPVDGLTAAELRSVVEAPGSPAARRRSGPVAERVAVGGRTVWRITVPGTYELLSARIVVAVGGTDVGEGVVTPDLATLVTVAPDPAVLVPGAPVTYRWGAGAPVAAGALEVVR